MTRTAHCKFCGRRLEIEIDDSCPVERVEAWVGMAVCDMCADYRYRHKPQRKAEREEIRAGLPYKDDE